MAREMAVIPKPCGEKKSSVHCNFSPSELFQQLSAGNIYTEPWPHIHNTQMNIYEESTLFGSGSEATRTKRMDFQHSPNSEGQS